MRVVVADDSALFRRVMSEVLASLPDVEVVGQAPNGRLAVQRAHELRPDLLTLDMQMPEMDGLAVLDALRVAGDAPAIIVVSAVTRQGGSLTLQALSRGAFDFITKPDGSGVEMSRDALRSDLAPRVAALSLRLGIRGILRSNGQSDPQRTPTARPEPASVAAPTQGHAVRGRAVDALGDMDGRMNRLAGTARPEMVLIGVSTGGPNALSALLPALPAGLGVPVLVVQHMPPLFTQTLAEMLAGRCALQVREAVDGEPLEPDTVYIAPGGRQMRVAPGPTPRGVIQVTDDPPENNVRPAVDYLFRSVSHHFPGRSMAVILTGMGSDGTLGLRLLKRGGCLVLAQDEASSVVYGMPGSAIAAGVVDAVVPLAGMAGRIVNAVRGAAS
jgi:two-component system, chemotaxis family, protein-glutamate methylesterase/glutaminase